MGETDYIPADGLQHMELVIDVNENFLIKRRECQHEQDGVRLQKMWFILSSQYAPGTSLQSLSAAPGLMLVRLFSFSHLRRILSLNNLKLKVLVIF